MPLPTIFDSREQAGNLLASRLAEETVEDPVVLALPRGGVPLALAVARRLAAPLGLMMVRKIGAPGQPELAIGAVADGETPVRVVHEHICRLLTVDEAYLREEEARQLAEIDRRRARYLAGRRQPAMKDRAVILVDDGIATGATVEAAIAAARKAGAREVIVAAPVAAAESAAHLRGLADRVITLLEPPDLGGISQFYRSFPQLEDQEVIDLLAAANNP